MVTGMSDGWGSYHFFYYLFRFHFWLPQQGPALGLKVCVRTMNSFKQKYIIRKQRQAIRQALDHIKHPNQKVTNEDFQDYMYHLGCIIDITSDIKTAHAAKKVQKI